MRARGRTSVLALFLPLVVVVTTAAACGSSPTSSAPKVVVATGDVSCTGVTGTVSFAPSLTNTGKSPESASISVTSTGCTTSGSDVHVTSGAGTATLSDPTNSCTGLVTPRQLTVDITWTPSTVHSSEVTFSGFSVATNGPGGGGGFTLPSASGTAKVSGSFAGSDHGAGSTSAVYSSDTVTKLLAACGSAAGLASIPVTSGSLTLK